MRLFLCGECTCFLCMGNARFWMWVVCMLVGFGASRLRSRAPGTRERVTERVSGVVWTTLLQRVGVSNCGEALPASVPVVTQSGECQKRCERECWKRCAT